jgi:hypothetical protein
MMRVDQAVDALWDKFALRVATLVTAPAAEKLKLTAEATPPNASKSDWSTSEKEMAQPRRKAQAEVIQHLPAHLRKELLAPTSKIRYKILSEAEAKKASARVGEILSLSKAAATFQGQASLLQQIGNFSARQRSQQAEEVYSYRTSSRLSQGKGGSRS